MDSMLKIIRTKEGRYLIQYDGTRLTELLPPSLLFLIEEHQENCNGQDCDICEELDSRVIHTIFDARFIDLAITEPDKITKEALRLLK